MNYICDCSIDEFIQFSSRIDIGIFYKNEEWKKDIYEKVTKYFIKLECIQWTHFGKYETYIRLKNGITYRFMKADDTARGYKFNYVYVQDDINLEDEDISGRIYSSIVHRQDICRLEKK